MKKVSFEQLGLVNLSMEEFQEINGGAWPKWLKGVTWVTVASEVIDHWDEIKKGLKEGWDSIK
jgi:hypothetical protein